MAGATSNYVAADSGPLCNKLATLVYLADQGTVSLHRWLSRRDRLNTPDLLVFDLDPSEVAGRDLRLVVDDADGFPGVDECREDNNTLLISEGLCE